MINSCRIFGSSSTELRRVLFFCYVLPIFTWLLAISPLFSECQRNYLAHFYSTCLKRVLQDQSWSDELFEFVYYEVPLVNRCARYWNKYFKALAVSKDGELLLEQLILNQHRSEWLEGNIKVHGLRRSKRFINHETILEKCWSWHDENPLTDTITQFSLDDIELLKEFPETF